MGVGAHHVAIYAPQHGAATEMGKAQFLPSRSSESSCRQTTQCLGISEVSRVADNQVNVFKEKMFNRHRRMVADFQVELLLPKKEGNWQKPVKVKMHHVLRDLIESVNIYEGPAVSEALFQVQNV